MVLLRPLAVMHLQNMVKEMHNSMVSGQASLLVACRYMVSRFAWMNSHRSSRRWRVWVQVDGWCWALNASNVEKGSWLGRYSNIIGILLLLLRKGL